MEQRVDYIAFDGRVFQDPEKARQYEIYRRLRTRRKILYNMVCVLSVDIKNSKSSIQKLEKVLYIINNKFRDSNFLNNPEHLQMLARRIEDRIQLNMTVARHKILKQMLKKVYREMSNVDNMLTKLVVD